LRKPSSNICPKSIKDRKGASVSYRIQIFLEEYTKDSKGKDTIRLARDPRCEF
jgi:hypothetical protein